MADNTPKPALPEADPKGNDDKNPQIFWTRLRIVSLAALSVVSLTPLLENDCLRTTHAQSFALLAVSSWLAARVAPIAVVTLKPHTEDDMTSGLFKSLADDIDTSNLHFDKTWTVNIGESSSYRVVECFPSLRHG